MGLFLLYRRLEDGERPRERGGKRERQQGDKPSLVAYNRKSHEAQVYTFFKRGRYICMSIHYAVELKLRQNPLPVKQIM